MSRAFYLSPMNSPISHLVDVLEKVSDAAQTFDLELKGNESATRAALIDPMLRALGWDVANPGRVLVEKTQTVQKKSSGLITLCYKTAILKLLLRRKNWVAISKKSFCNWLITHSA